MKFLLHSFLVVVWFVAAAPQVVAQTDVQLQGMLYDQTLEGVLEHGIDSSQTDAGGLEFIMDYNWFDGQAGDQVVIAPRSAAFDAYLLLYEGEEGDALVENDDFDGADAQISATLPSNGRYVISVTSSYELQSGPYEISLIRMGN